MGFKHSSCVKFKHIEICFFHLHSLAIMYYSQFLHLKCMNCYNIRFLYLLFPCILKYLICKISDVLHLFLLDSNAPQNLCAKCRRQNGSNMSFPSSLKRKHDGKLSESKQASLKERKIQTIWTIGVIFMEYCLTGLVVWMVNKRQLSCGVPSIPKIITQTRS